MTDWSASRQFADWLDTPLTPRPNSRPRVLRQVDGQDLGSRSIIGDGAYANVFEEGRQVTLTVRRGVQMTRDVSFTPRRNSADL